MYIEDYNFPEFDYMCKLKMSGIYRLVNLLDGRCYIGQSMDLFQRYREHIWNKKSKIDADMYYLGKENFGFEILQVCDPDPELLDHLEEIYIVIYRSNDPDYGYNISCGGQHNQVGERNTNAKLTPQDVYDIRESYKNHESKRAVYERYKDKITFGGFEGVWWGKCWIDVHMDVYTPENKNFYTRETSVGELSRFSIFTDDEVIQLRTRYINESAKEIYESVKDRCNYQTLQQILWGRHYSHLPVYNKKIKQWVNSINT